MSLYIISFPSELYDELNLADKLKNPFKLTLYFAPQIPILIQTKMIELLKGPHFLYIISVWSVIMTGHFGFPNT